MAGPVTIYTVDDCGFCEEMVAFFRKRGVPHREVRLNNLSDRELSKVTPKILVDGAVSTPISVVGGKKLVGASEKVKNYVLCKTVDRSACDA